MIAAQERHRLGAALLAVTAKERPSAGTESGEHQSA
jgi:hypothetical protein